MVSIPTKLVVMVATAGLVLAGAVGVVGADRVGVSGTDLGDAHGADGTAAAGAPPPSEQAAGSACAVEPPDSMGDPPRDVIGWENGIWYNESIDVDQSDGLGEAELDALVARTMARVEFIRCVEFDSEVPVSVINRTEFRERDFGQEMTPELRMFDNAKFEALFLVGEDADSIEVQRQNRGASILGFYSPQSSEIVLVAEDRANLQIGEFTLAHELVHAWQDEQFDLTSDELSPGVRDEVNARNGLTEGDANYVQHLYRQRCEEGAWSGSCLQAPAGGGGELANIGIYLMKFQPYSDGPVFVRTVRNMGGWDAVNAVYERVPESTEQVIHPERYRSDPPADPEIEDRTTDDWTRVAPPNRPNYGSVGEAALVSMFAYPYYHSEGEDQILPPEAWLNFDEQGEVDAFDPLDYDVNYTEGWDGDRLHVYENGDDELAYVWRLEWDSPQDAREFVRGYRRVLQYWGAEEVGDGTYRIDEGGFADAFHVSVEGTTVTIVNAPTVEQLDTVRTDLESPSDESEQRPPGLLAPRDRSEVATGP